MFFSEKRCIFLVKMGVFAEKLIFFLQKWGFLRVFFLAKMVVSAEKMVKNLAEDDLFGRDDFQREESAHIDEVWVGAELLEEVVLHEELGKVDQLLRSAQLRRLGQSPLQTVMLLFLQFFHFRRRKISDFL